MKTFNKSLAPHTVATSAHASVNITRGERAGRMLIGAAAVIAAVVLLTSAGTAVAVVLELLLIVAGLDLVVTGARGHCPLYQKLGHVPSSLRSGR